MEIRHPAVPIALLVTFGAPVPGKPFAGRDFHHIWKVLGAALRALGDLDVSEPAGPDMS